MSVPPVPHTGSSGSRLTVEVFPLGLQAARVRVRGELDLATVPQLAPALSALLGAGRHQLDVDLDEVTFCDVAGLTALLQANARAVQAGGRLVVHGSCPPLRLMLRVLRPEPAFAMIPELPPPGGAEA